MFNTDTGEDTAVLAKDAMQGMSEHGVPPTPDNFPV